MASAFTHPAQRRSSGASDVHAAAHAAGVCRHAGNTRFSRAHRCCAFAALPPECYSVTCESSVQAEKRVVQCEISISPFERRSAAMPQRNALCAFKVPSSAIRFSDFRYRCHVLRNRDFDARQIAVTPCQPPRRPPSSDFDAESAQC